jgi:putative SOS response-associated peptidase YedK
MYCSRFLPCSDVPFLKVEWRLTVWKIHAVCVAKQEEAITKPKRSIITTEANELLKQVHDRMPGILRERLKAGIMKAKTSEPFQLFL